MDERDGLFEAAAWIMKELRFERLMAEFRARHEADEEACDAEARRPA